MTAAVALMATVAIVFLAFLNRNSESTEPDPTVAAPSSDIGDSDSAVSTTIGSDGAAEVEPSAIYVRARLEASDFTLSGTVADPELAQNLLQSAQVAYSPFVRSELMIDEQLENVDWLDTSPAAIVLLPMITDGSILITDGLVTVSGRAPTLEAVQRLEGALAELTNLPVVVENVDITNLDPPSLRLAAAEGRVTLSGTLPTDDFREAFTRAATATNGPENVDNQVVVDDAVYVSLWMYNADPLMQAMSAFPEYDLRIDGNAFSGFINGGVTFQPNSADFSGDYAQVLDVGVSVLTRDQSLRLVIEGHTDSDGPAEVNLELSQRRAEAVMEYFIANGIAPERLTALGKGEAEPVTTNETIEGRARNRRIQYVLSSEQ